MLYIRSSELTHLLIKVVGLINIFPLPHLPGPSRTHYTVYYYKFDFFFFFYISRISEITQYLFLCIWFTSRNIMPLWSIRVVTHGRTSSFIKAE